MLNLRLISVKLWLINDHGICGISILQFNLLYKILHRELKVILIHIYPTAPTSYCIPYISLSYTLSQLQRAVRYFKYVL